MYCFIPQPDGKVLQGNTLKTGQNLEPFISVEVVTQIPMFVPRNSLELNCKFGTRDFLRNSVLRSVEFLQRSKLVVIAKATKYAVK